MSTSPLVAAIQHAAGTVERHREVVCLALSTEREEMRYSARKFSDKGLHSAANERRELEGRAISALAGVERRAHLMNLWMESHWETLLRAAVLAEATDLVLADISRKWLAEHAEDTEATAYKVTAWQLSQAVAHAAQLSEVKDALTAVRDAMNTSGRKSAKPSQV
ncbi:hypothetical protein [Actinacidiphila glaucinigra]|uniref:Uncharacterized protein n=1 Tax=Actinacidiphila glaucinigra TaxID=235986 RepID=A0A239EZR8_9ACTN|nr:hypothetical protein [Actinacidiphila glaucinigra]SNS50119.1 hypothetical protein SAMN05216252_106237 [Actinacidiphila glaucinigra]